MNSKTLDVLQDIRRVGDGFQSSTVSTANGVTYGAHHMFTQVVIAEMAAPGKRLLNLQTVFSWGGVGGEPVDVTVETLQSGRSFTFLTLTYRQGERVLTRAEALLTVDEPDYLCYVDSSTVPTGLPTWVEGQMGDLWPGISYRDPSSSIKEASSWYRIQAPVDNHSVTRGLTALATEMGVLGALAAHDDSGGIRPRQGHVNVLAQNVTLYHLADLREGIVVRAAGRYAGQGRAYGDGTILDLTGRPIGSFSTTAVARGETVESGNTPAT